MQQSVKLKIGKQQYDWLSSELKKNCQRDTHNLPQLVLLEMYFDKLRFFNFWSANKKNEAAILLKPSQATALHQCFQNEDFYNIFLRMKIEPFLQK